MVTYKRFLGIMLIILPVDLSTSTNSFGYRMRFPRFQPHFRFFVRPIYRPRYSMPRIYHPNYRHPYHHSYRSRNHYRYVRRHPTRRQPKLSPTQWVLANLRVAQKDLQTKNYFNASLQLMGSENLLTGMVKKQPKHANTNETNLDRALRNVRLARHDLATRNLDALGIDINETMLALQNKPTNKTKK